MESNKNNEMIQYSRISILNTQRRLHHTEPVQKYVQLLINSQYAGSS